MVSLKTVAAVTICFAAAFFMASAYFGTLPTITQTLTDGATQLKTSLAPLIDGWNALPSTVKSVVMLGIPTLITLFFAWTKNRAMQKLNETKLEAAATTKQLSGELTQAEQSARTATQENLDLQKRLAVYEKDGDAVTALKDINTDLQAKLDLYQKQVDQLTTERNIAQTNYNTLFEKCMSDPLLKKYVQP